MTCRCISKLTIGKYMAPADHSPFPHCRLPSHNVSTASQVGCAQIASNSTLIKLMWCTSTRKLTQRPSSPLAIAGALVHPVYAIHDLSLRSLRPRGASTHVRRTVSRCFAALRQLRHLRRYATNNCYLSLVVSLVHTRLNYSN